MSDVYLRGERLERCTLFKYLGYVMNHNINDHDMVERQARRLNSIANNFKRDLPLYLLDDSRLRKIAMAYGNIYMLPIMYDVTNACLKILRVAHRNFVSLITQFHQRSEFWNPDKGIYKPWNRYIYGRLQIPTLSTMISNQAIGFRKRFDVFCANIVSA